MRVIPGFLRHYTDQLYDPVKAHQYYEDHKNLKGRSSGQNSSGTSRSGSSSSSSGASKVAAPQKTAEQRRAEFEAQVAALKARLELLKSILAELVAEAKRRSGVDPTEPAKAREKTDELTPSEKADRAKKAHDYYEETKGTLPSQETTHVLQTKIKAIEKKIAEMRERLATLVEQTKPSPSGPDPTNSKEANSQNGT
jgi:uncharacterized protein YceH (UPF0502 family)